MNWKPAAIWSSIVKPRLETLKPHLKMHTFDNIVIALLTVVSIFCDRILTYHGTVSRRISYCRTLIRQDTVTEYGHDGKQRYNNIGRLQLGLTMR
jgi:hypothetical protein